MADVTLPHRRGFAPSAGFASPRRALMTSLPAMVTRWKARAMKIGAES